jgi:nitric oxide dioxygenase
MNIALSKEHIATVKSTIPLLESAGTAITEHFYKRLFSHNPELQHIFNTSNQHSGKQQFALFNAVAAYAKNIDNLAVLNSAVERIANKHNSLNIQAEHYPIVGHHLLETLRELAGDAFTPQVEDAWTAAYQFLADIFINTESGLYDERSQQKGGWKDGRKFRLVEKKIESELVKSIVFEPIDGAAVADYQSGQYIGIELSLPNRDYREMRQYSLSDTANGENYRISVKREIAGTPGVVSNFLHDGLHLGDEVTLYTPAGDFFYKEKQKPVVLISAGVGITPMQSIVETLAKTKAAQDILYLHACENNEQHSFKKRITQLSQRLSLQSHTWYKSDNSDNDNIHHGYMDLTIIEDKLPINDGDFYLCGPVSFMQFVKQQLITLGVNNECIHYEVFGPHEAF